jgi:pyridoxamine 5'-phosphate oxidase
MIIIESRKGGELAINPYCAITFWWDVLHRQIRIEGKVSRISDEESTAYFVSRPRESQVLAIRLRRHYRIMI